jgi:hypothetical protein
MSDQVGARKAPLQVDFRPSYRPERPAPGLGMDPDMRRIGMLAAGVGGALALLLGLSLLLHHGRREVPVIDAQAGPVRIKPADRGGMTVTGADLPTHPGQGPQLAPEAEKPEMHAMKRQLAKEAADAAQAQQAARLAQAAAARPRVAAAAPVEHASATARIAVPAEADRGVRVQVGAFADAQAAQVEWDQLRGKLPELLAGRRPEVSRVDTAGRTMWRLRTGGFASVEQATGFCGKMRAKGADCSIAAF